MQAMTTIQRDAESRGDLIAWWEQEELEDSVELVCGKHEAAVFLSEDEVLFTLGPGRYPITADDYEELSDWLDGDDDTVEVAFITTTPKAVDSTGEFARQGEKATFTASSQVRITDATAAIDVLENLADDESLEDWLGDELAEHLADAMSETPVLPDSNYPEIVDISLGAFNFDVEAEAKRRAAEVLTDYGIEVVSVPTIEYTLSPELQARLEAEAVAGAKAQLEAIKK
jgi:hypothetical protein